MYDEGQADFYQLMMCLYIWLMEVVVVRVVLRHLRIRQTAAKCCGVDLIL